MATPSQPSPQSHGLELGVMIASAAVAVVCAVTGLLAKRSALDNQYLLAGTAGLLTGLSVLVVLPQAIESRGDKWSVESLLAFFVAAPVVMFIIEHVVLEHEHHRPKEECCEPCEVVQPPFGKAIRCLRPKESSRLLPPAKAPAAAPPAAPERTALGGALFAMGACFRMLAWEVHALMDGFILGTSKTTATLVALAFAISVCAVQDVVGFCVQLQRRGYGSTHTTVVITCFALTFPAGAAISLVTSAALVRRARSHTRNVRLPARSRHPSRFRVCSAGGLGHVGRGPLRGRALSGRVLDLSAPLALLELLPRDHGHG